MAPQINNPSDDLCPVDEAKGDDDFAALISDGYVSLFWGVGGS